VPICHLTCWWDFVVQGTVANFTGLRREGDPTLRDRHRLIIGPWSHQPGATAPGAGAVSYGPAERRAYHDLIADWYDVEFHGSDAAGLADGPVHAYVVNENSWRSFSDWPPPEATPLELYLDSGGAANWVRGDGRLAAVTPRAGTPSHFEYDPRDPVMSISDWSTRAVDRSVLDHRRDILVYRSEPLDRELLLMGSATCVLWAATDAVETDFTATLVEERPDGLAIGLATGIVRTRFLDGYDRVVRLEPGTPYELVIELSPVGVRLAPGTRIRLDISSSDFPNFDRNHNTGHEYWADAELRVARQTVFNDSERPSRLVVDVLAL
jgi:putative CocE/NonD family hydrolase